MSFIDEPITSFAQLRKTARKIGRKKMTVAVAQEEIVLQAMLKAEDLGLIEPILIGNQDHITSMADGFGWKVPPHYIIHEADHVRSIRRAVEMVRDGQADFVMKGKATSADIYQVVLDREMDMRRGRFLSQVVVCEVPGLNRLILISDASVLISPNLKQKADMCRNAIDLAHALGMKQPRLAALAALELVNADIASTIDAACLTMMNKRNQITGAIIDGPIALDAALAEWAAKEKGFESPISGCTDIFICPDVNAANILVRAAIYLARAESGGLVLGASVPVLAFSRAEPVETKINSICLGILMTYCRENNLL